MNFLYKNKFNEISINGRYIYIYICLILYLRKNNLPDLPISLEDDLEEFVSSNLLDDWQAKIEEVIPSFILANEYSSQFFEYILEEDYIKLKNYYNNIDSKANKIIENIIWIGASNIS